MTEAPEVIYLQWIPEKVWNELTDEVTWCVDQINDDDIEYIKKAESDRQAKAIRAAIAKLEGPGMSYRAREAIHILTEATDDSNNS